MVPLSKPRPMQRPRWFNAAIAAALAVFVSLVWPAAAHAGEADLVLPDLRNSNFHGISGHNLLMLGLLLCFGGLAFGLVIYKQLRTLPVHKSMLEVSELIYETCKTYLKTQGKFILLLWVFIAVIMVIYFGFLADKGATHDAAVTGDTKAAVAAAPVIQADAKPAMVHKYPTPLRVTVILLFSLIGIAGSYAVAWFGIRVNTFANSRTAMASLRGMPFLVYSIPLRAGMAIGMVLISVELVIMLTILLFLPSELAGPCFIGFAIGESLGAAVLRIAGGIFTKIADIGADLMKIVFKIEEDDA